MTTYWINLLRKCISGLFIIWL